MPGPKKIVIGTRASLLSLTQTEGVISLFKSQFPQYKFSLKKITTQGDRLKTWTQDSEGIFVKELEEALLNGEIDLAIHSMKDVPTLIPSPLRLVAVTRREDPRDVLISKRKSGFFNLRSKALIGTSSLRRGAQLLHWRPDIKIKQLRGNLDTRIRKLKNNQFDAIVVAAAGILRLRRAKKEIDDLLSSLCLDYLSPGILLPAAGQGVLGIEARGAERVIKDIAARINDRQTYICITAERAFLRALGGGCRVPIGALARMKDRKITLEVMVVSLDGRRVVRRKGQAELSKAEIFGRGLAQEVLEAGGREILRNIL
jgi:hydroxymethylbilane synthase